MIQQALGVLLDGHDLAREQAREAMEAIMTGEATPAQIGGFLVALRIKGETPDEIAGFAEAIRGHVLAVTPQRDDLVDTAGTGGDNENRGRHDEDGADHVRPHQYPLPSPPVEEDAGERADQAVRQQ